MNTSKTHPEIVLVGPFWTRSEATQDLSCDDACLLGRDDVLRIGARLGDKEASKAMLDEVMKSGNEAQKQEAKLMLDEL